MKKKKLSHLESYIQKHRLDEVRAMNILQSAGLVSDNAVNADDVYESVNSKMEELLSSL